MGTTAQVDHLRLASLGMRLLVRSGLSAVLLGIMAWPFAPSLPAAAMTSLFALPFALALVLVVSLLAGPRSLKLGQHPRFVLVIFTLVAAGVVWSLGAYVSNVALVDDALQVGTLLGYAASAGAAIAVAAAVGRLLRRTGLGSRLLGAAPRSVVAWVSLGLGMGLVVLDASFLTEGYLTFHLSLVVAALVLFGIFATAITDDRRTARWAALVALLGVGGALLSGFTTPLRSTYDEMSDSLTMGRRLLIVLRRAADRDGDGYSAAFGGGDCDDHDPRAFPLSMQGKDCLGWSRRQPPVSDWAPPPAGGVAAGPQLILLVTVDALRCDSGAAIFEGLAPLCPELDLLAAEGTRRDDAHTTYPSTENAIGSLHNATAYVRDRSVKRTLLAEWMTMQGRKSHAVATHPKQMPAKLKGSFTTVDVSLLSLARNGSASSSEKVTDQALTWLRTIGDSPAFLWVHYYDPHSPYADPPGSRSALAPAVTRYAAEVRRTDKAAARLIREAAALTPSMLALTTADHGEEFAEHGRWYHGTGLYDTATRVPMIAWSAAHRETIPSALPSSLSEVAPFLTSVARGAPFISSNEAFFWVASHGKRLVGFYREGYKLSYDEGLNLTALFHIASDPEERKNLFHERPSKVAELGARLAAYLAPPGSAVAPQWSER